MANLHQNSNIAIYKVDNMCKTNTEYLQFIGIVDFSGIETNIAIGTIGAINAKNRPTLV